MTAQEALQRLKDGNHRFVKEQWEGKFNDSKRRNSLVDGQSPYAIVLSCADSRVVPELAFDTGLGELFVIRVAGNVANTESIASIEYAVAHLNTKLIMILGHQNCGAVTAAMAIAVAIALAMTIAAAVTMTMTMEMAIAMAIWWRHPAPQIKELGDPSPRNDISGQQMTPPPRM